MPDIPLIPLPRFCRRNNQTFRLTPETVLVADTAEAAAPEGSFEEDEELESNQPTKICPVCNAKVDVDALFCNHCGAQL